MGPTLGNSSDPEMVALVDRVLESGERTENDLKNFATPGVGLIGNCWDLPAGGHGWRREAQEWGERHGLVEEERVEGRDGGLIAFTDRGRKFQEELKRRGLTLLAS